MNVEPNSTTVSSTARSANEVTFDGLEAELVCLHDLLHRIERRAESALVEPSRVAVSEDLGDIRRTARTALLRLADLRWCP